MLSSKNVPVSDCNGDWQLEIVILPPRAEILIFVEQWQHRNSNGKTSIFNRDKLDKSGAKWLVITTDSRKWQDWHPKHLYCLFSCPSSFGDSYWAERGQKCWVCHWNFDAVCHSSRDKGIFGFGGHITISSCWPLLQSLADTFFELCMVVCLRFAIEISILCHSFRNISVLAAISSCRSWLDFLSSSRSKTSRMPLDFWWYLSCFQRYKYIGVGIYLVVWHCCICLWALSLSFLWLKKIALTSIITVILWKHLAVWQDESSWA